MERPNHQDEFAPVAVRRTEIVLWKAERNWLRLVSGLVVMVDTDDELIAEYAPTGVRFIDHIPQHRVLQ